jgi:hypothetical protein
VVLGPGRAVLARRGRKLEGREGLVGVLPRAGSEGGRTLAGASNSLGHTDDRRGRHEGSAIGPSLLLDDHEMSARGLA